jgi:effector-binding domain-containing protein
VFRIGDFSRFSYVSIKALRYYDELGLLKPDRVDPSTGYRYYSAEQLPRLNRIIALKDLGFTLDQIAIMLGGKISAEQIKGILKAKRVEIERQIADDQEKLLRVESRIRIMEAEENALGNIDVIIKKVEAQKVVGIREKVNDCSFFGNSSDKKQTNTFLDRDLIDSYPAVGGLFEKLCKIIQAKGGKLNPPGIAVYYDAEYKETDVDMEAVLPITGFELNVDNIKTYTLPAISSAACLIHHGNYDVVIKAYDVLIKWIEENSFKINGPVREIYIQTIGFGAKDRNDCITEIQFPVEKKNV